MATDSLPIRLLQDEEPEVTLITLLHRALDLCSIQNDESRAAVIECDFAKDVVWFDSDGTISKGHESMIARSSEIVKHRPERTYRLIGEPSFCQNLVTQAWECVPQGTEGNTRQRPIMRGRDVLIVENHKIKVLWSCVEEAYET